MTSTYLAGDLPTLVTSDGVVVAAADRLAEVAALVGRPLEVLTVVEVLSRGVLSEVPDFAAVRRDGDEVHVCVRGGFTVLVDGFSVDGRSATTWAEASASVGPGSAVEVVAPGTTPGGLALPLAHGVVRSAGVTWHPAGAPEPAGRAEERTVVRAPAGSPAAPAAPLPPAPQPVPSAAPPALPPPALPPPAPAGPPAPPPYHPPVAPGPSTTAVAPAAWQPGEDADHDGRTITPAQLQALRAGQAPPAPTAPPVRPKVALQLSTGRVVPVRRRVLLGRNPRVQQVGGSANLPALVTVDDPYVSSTHLEVAADGSRITVTDMSTNGTLLARRGGVPFPLEHGVATEVGVGDVLTLSKGLTATVVPAPVQAAER